MTETGATHDQIAAMQQVEGKLGAMLEDGYSTYDLLQDILTHHPDILDDCLRG